MNNHYYVFGSQELSNNKRCVNRVRPHGGETNCCLMFALNGLSWPLQNLIILALIVWPGRGLCIPCRQAHECQKYNNLDFTWLQTWTHFQQFFQPWWIWWFPWFITSYDTGNEFGFLSNLLLEFCTDRNVVELLFITQQS